MVGQDNKQQATRRLFVVLVVLLNKKEVAIMSRSFKKNHIIKDSGKSKKIGKRFANKKVRKSLYLSSGCCYKKVYDSWNICDYKHLGDLQNMWQRQLERNIDMEYSIGWRRNGKYIYKPKTYLQVRNDYLRQYVRK